jgi:hypothetical protein
MAEKVKEAKEKPLEKMTAKELREVAKEIPQILGVHGMNKAELVSEIKAARGIVEEKKAQSNASVRDIKKKIKALKAEQQTATEAKDKKQSTIYRRRISRLKKKTRSAA